MPFSRAGGLFVRKGLLFRRNELMKKQSKKEMVATKKQRLLFFSLLALFFLVCLMPAARVKAKESTFRQCGREVKTGKYYIWRDDSSRCLYISTSKSGNGKVLVKPSAGRQIESGQISDGSTVYYVETKTSEYYGNCTGYVYRIKVNGSGKKQIGKLKNISEPTAYYNGNLYFTCIDKNDPTLMHTYRMNVKNGATKRAIKNVYVSGQKGQYLLARPNTGALMPLPLYVYNCKTGKAVCITKKGGTANFSGSKIYYSEFVKESYGGSDNIFRIRSCTLSGKGKKTLANNIKATYTGMTTSKYAYYYVYNSSSDQKYYRYNLKTKKKSRISQADYLAW